ncbi:MAG: hypothetical protein QG622_14 [Actinomycetota bacterium]|nr:hypothetical protein [Actinomycetota bacterium]
MMEMSAMARTIRATTRTAVLMCVMLVGVSGCATGVSTTAIPSVAGTDRICRMFSEAAVRTVAGGKDPKVTQSHVNVEPQEGSLLGSVCVIEAGDMYLKVNVNWQGDPGIRAREKAELALPPSDEKVRVFPAEAGVGYISTTRAREAGIDGTLLRGQYKLTVSLNNVPAPRDAIADAQALVLQVTDALAIPVSESAARPKAPRG